MTDKPIIRRALDSDVTTISACAKAAYSMYIERIGKPPAPMIADFATQIAENKIHVIEQRQQLVGFSVCFPLSSVIARAAVPEQKSSRNAPVGVYFLENIAVDPPQQGAGIGKLLIDHVIAMARQDSCCSLDLYTNEMMVENIGWYSKLGFREVTRKHEDGFNRVYMRLDLND